MWGVLDLALNRGQSTPADPLDVRVIQAVKESVGIAGRPAGIIRGAQLLEQILVRVYGGSAVATYRYAKTWLEGGVRHREQGWSSDVFELRDDGAWLLILRHRDR